MTPAELAALPIGSIIRQDEEEGEIVQAGAVCHIMWPESKCTNIIDTNARGWENFIRDLEAE